MKPIEKQIAKFKAIIERSKAVEFTSIDRLACTGTTGNGYTVSLTACTCPAHKAHNGHIATYTKKAKVIQVCKHIVALARECGLVNLRQLKNKVDGKMTESLSDLYFGDSTNNKSVGTVIKAKPQVTFKYDKFKNISWISLSYATNEAIRDISDYAKERGLSCAIVPINGLTEVLLSHQEYTAPADSYALMMRLAYHLISLGYQVSTKG